MITIDEYIQQKKDSLRVSDEELAGMRELYAVIYAWYQTESERIFHRKFGAEEEARKESEDLKNGVITIPRGSNYPDPLSEYRLSYDQLHAFRATLPQPERATVEELLEIGRMMACGGHQERYFQEETCWNGETVRLGDLARAIMRDRNPFPKEYDPSNPIELTDGCMPSVEFDCLAGTPKKYRFQLPRKVLFPKERGSDCFVMGVREQKLTDTRYQQWAEKFFADARNSGSVVLADLNRSLIPDNEWENNIVTFWNARALHIEPILDEHNVVNRWAEISISKLLIGAGGDRWKAAISYTNHTDTVQEFIIHKGQFIENSEMGTGVQNVAVAREYSVAVPAQTSEELLVDIYCANEPLHSPCGLSGNLTNLRVDCAFDGQGQLWAILNNPLI